MENCFICGASSKFRVPYINEHVNESVIKWGSYYIDVCNNCGFGSIEPSISVKTLQEFYLVESLNSPNSHNPNFFNNRNRELAQPLALSMFFESQNLKKIKFLDYGCGTFGYAFNSFSKVFGREKMEFNGIDPDSLAEKVLKKNGIEYLGIDYMVLQEHPRKFDIILMSHVLEHLNQEDAIKCLNVLQASLESGGHLIIDVPHNDFRNKKQQNLSFAPHVMFFTPDSLRKILELCGYQVLYCRVFGPNWQDYEKSYITSVLHPSKIKYFFQYIKSMIPISWKENLKNLFLKEDSNKFLKDPMLINSQGVFLRAIAVKK